MFLNVEQLNHVYEEDEILRRAVRWEVIIVDINNPFVEIDRRQTK